MRRLNKAVIFILVLILGISFGFSQDVKQIKKEFDKKKEVQITTVSGDCIVEVGNSDKILVVVEYDVEPADAFKPEFDERSNSIRLKERWTGSSSGHVVWKLKVPKGTDVEFSSASGDLSVSNVSGSIEASTASGDISVESCEGKIDISSASGDIELFEAHGEIDISTASGVIEAREAKGEIEFSTASGDIDLKDSEGEFEFSTASGDIDLKDSEGEFDLSTASGDIEAKGIILNEEGSFSTASGDIEIKLAKTAGYDMEISTASGDAILDYAGNELTGYFEFIARKDKGDIIAPVSFDREEEFEKHGRTYERKSFSAKGNSPKITISTSSGKAVLKK